MFDKLEWFFFESAIGKLITVFLFSLTCVWVSLTGVWMVIGFVEGIQLLFSIPLIFASIGLFALTEILIILLFIKTVREAL